MVKFSELQFVRDKKRRINLQKILKTQSGRDCVKYMEF